MVDPELREELENKKTKRFNLDSASIEKIWVASGNNDWKFEDLVNFAFSEGYNACAFDVIKFIDESLSPKKKMVDFKEKVKKEELGE